MSIEETRNRIRALRRDRRYLVDRYERLEEQLAATENLAATATSRCKTLREELDTIEELLTKETE